MKKIYTTVSFIILVLWLSANPVSKELAKKVAINFMSAKKSMSIDTFSVKNVYTQSYNSANAFFIFTFPKGGFVIVSADDNANPIIGYSLTSPVTENIDNPVILKRFEWYAKQVDHAATLKSSKKDIEIEWLELTEGKYAKAYKVAGPLLQTTWDQSPYYNQLCPTGTPTGCVATAMSQIMKYHNWPASGNGWHKYTHSTYGIQYANFEYQNYDWLNMTNSLTSTSTNTEKEAIATLCYHAGVSVNMNYAADGSGAYSADVLYALTSYFKYDPSSINIYDFDANNQTEWINQIKTEIDAGRPVYYSGSSDASGGHAWVCDGYDDNNYLHINWGWGGIANGYFQASAMNPGSYNFSESNGMITGIMPGNVDQNLLWTKQSSAFSASSRGIRHISAVNNRIVWAVAYDGSSSSATVKDFTRTEDGGSTWKSGTINASGTSGYTASMITAVSEKVAWVPLFNGTSGGGKIAKTTDGGGSWTIQSSAVYSAPNGFPNVIHFWNANIGFCMGDPNDGYFEIYTTTNGGENWYRTAQSNIPANLDGEYGTIGLYAVYGDIVWFSTNKGRVYKSTNKGYNWTVIQTPISESTFKISFKDQNTGVIQNSSNDDLYLTTDGGNNWTKINPIGNLYSSDIIFQPTTGTLISTGSDYSNNKMGVSYSLDNGNTFYDYANFYKNFQFLALGASPNGTVWAGGFNSSSSYGGMWHMGEKVISGNFNVNISYVVKNDSSVVFTETSYGTPDSWEWNFGADASPATLSGQGPHTVKYTDYGYKTVVLTISRGEDQQVIIKNNFIYVTWPAGVDTENENSHILYPNPASQDIYVRISGFEKGSISVFDMRGALVWKSQGVTEDDRVNISNLSSGVYIVKINTNDGSVLSRKLTISR